MPFHTVCGIFPNQLFSVFNQHYRICLRLPCLVTFTYVYNLNPRPGPTISDGFRPLTGNLGEWGGLGVCRNRWVGPVAARISDVPASNCRTQFDRPQLHPVIHGNGTSNAHATGNIFLAPHLQNGRRASKDPSEARRLPEGSSMSIEHHRGGCAGGWSALVPLTRCLPSGNAGSCQRKIQSVDPVALP